ncbi:hypothetical protein Ppa06_07340 [Planomonospora parontospora subsp. parontospora]|uniref:DUF3558 domain-containing protein n=2 Tax=Planomonospora parontospora TaxID=58119 RepID=A0AA37BCW5_9ACTN|nr:hypothetical protein [Planomonospora parontospora]GGK51938.1 hypothetical protein GCM10010126_09270 [Planomonospora parontospora]GII06936.1 hypothetical protein Ppa06_07340 [Planomonospora parontospora subsp. parontospora]
MSSGSPEPPATPATAPAEWGPTVPSPVPSPGPRRWLPPVAGVTALALAAGGGSYLLVSWLNAAGAPAPAASPAAPASQGPAGPPDVCAMLDRVDVDRLVPQAKVSDSTNDNRASSPAYVNWSCSWQNMNYSYGEYRRSRQINVKVTQYEGEKTETADTVARRNYGYDLESARYAENHPQKDYYYSAVRKLQGAGDEAHVQYTWSKGKTKYAFGTGFGRVGDVTVKVEYQADQQPKDVPLFSDEGKQSVTEQNALREAELLMRQVSEAVAAWRQGRPYARSAPRPTSSPTPSPTPTPVEIAFPKVCAEVTPVAAPLVPGAALKSERTQSGDRTAVTCRWNNREIPAGGKHRLRSVFVTFTTFVDRVGKPDSWAAKQHYIDRRAEAKEWEGSGFQGLFWYKVTEPKGWGERAFHQYRKNRTPSAHVGVADAVVLSGPTVVEVSFGGSDRPEGTGINDPKSVLMPQQEVVTGLVPVTEAVLESFRRNGVR